MSISKLVIANYVLFKSGKLVKKDVKSNDNKRKIIETSQLGSRCLFTAHQNVLSPFSKTNLYPSRAQRTFCH
jgi:hypothetical protein